MPTKQIWQWIHYRVWKNEHGNVHAFPVKIAKWYLLFAAKTIQPPTMDDRELNNICIKYILFRVLKRFFKGSQTKVFNPYSQYFVKHLLTFVTSIKHFLYFFKDLTPLFSTLLFQLFMLKSFQLTNILWILCSTKTKILKMILEPNFGSLGHACNHCFECLVIIKLQYMYFDSPNSSSLVTSNSQNVSGLSKQCFVYLSWHFEGPSGLLPAGCYQRVLLPKVVRPLIKFKGSVVFLHLNCEWFTSMFHKDIQMITVFLLLA